VAREPLLSRRRFLAGAGAAGVAGVAATTFGATVPPATAATGVAPGSAVPFHGPHQAGIVTPAQDRLLFATFDVADGITRGDVVDLLHRWTRASERMTAGLPVGRDDDTLDAPPDDTGEAVGLGPASLTVTFGFGPTFFTRDGQDRFGIADHRPAALVDLPTFANEELDPDRSDGDLAVQACADDPTVCFHAVRDLARIGRGVVTLRWTQLGFGRTSSTSDLQTTPRNLMGFKDGTNNLKVEDRAAIATSVWVGPRDDPVWMRGGSYVVIRRIRMLLEVWDRSTLDDQQRTIGRTKAVGAPLGGHAEHDPVHLTSTRAGEPVIPRDAHIRLAAPATNGGAALLRRGYSFTDGIDPVTNQLDAGLFFVAFQRDPRAQFVPIQRRLDGDALNEYVQHTTSGIYACPPGVAAGGYVGETLFG
jgi:deferrochelatase/peroxidase EfeB